MIAINGECELGYISWAASVASCLARSSAGTTDRTGLTCASCRRCSCGCCAAISCSSNFRCSSSLPAGIALADCLCVAQISLHCPSSPAGRPSHFGVRSKTMVLLGQEM